MTAVLHLKINAHEDRSSVCLHWGVTMFSVQLQSVKVHTGYNSRVKCFKHTGLRNRQRGFDNWIPLLPQIHSDNTSDAEKKSLRI